MNIRPIFLEILGKTFDRRKQCSGSGAILYLYFILPNINGSQGTQNPRGTQKPIYILEVYMYISLLLHTMLGLDYYVPP